MPSKYRWLSNTNAFSGVNVCVNTKRTRWGYGKSRVSRYKIVFLFASEHDLSYDGEVRRSSVHVTTAVFLRTFTELYTLAEDQEIASSLDLRCRNGLA